MSVLMPQGAYRHCLLCAWRWYTAHVDECACPDCGGTVPESLGHDFVCTHGHRSLIGGSCTACKVLASAKQAKEERRVAASPDWVDRT